MEAVLIVFLAILLVIGIVLAEAWVLMFTWNVLVPALLNGPELTFVQGLALVFVINFLAVLFKRSKKDA